MNDRDRYCLDMLGLFADAITDLHDPRNDGHQRRCVELAISLAFKLGLPYREIELIGYAMRFHDIGKLGIPEAILSKPVLSDSEKDQVHGHSANGSDVLSVLPIEGMELIADIARHHQENWDGTGYPDGLKGDEISIGAQIARVVDFFDALTNDRVYRKKLTMKDALVLMESKNGEWISPNVFHTFKQIVDE